MSDTKNLKHLGSNKTDYKYDTADVTLLETFENANPGEAMEIYIKHPEFTSLCPKTGQPDFATIHVWYVPDKLCVESKSFKLYCGSFRQFGEFHEDCTARILKDLRELLNPRQIKVQGEFKPRGGISFIPTAIWKQPQPK